MAYPLVSILIVVKNGERFLPSALESVRSQAYLPIELILVDGHSTDRTSEIAKAFDGLRYVPQNDLGLANARNRALRCRRGKLVAFLDADDVWEADKLHLQAAYLWPPTPIAWVWWRIYASSWGRGIVRSVRETDGHYRQVKVGFTPSALLARRELFRLVGPFDPTCSLACDADWFARLFDAGLQVDVLPQSLLCKRIHNFNLSLDIARSRNVTLCILKKSMRRKCGTAGTRWLKWYSYA